MKKKIKPFVKWAGGKTQILPFLRIIADISYKTYFEPFLGSGSLFLDLLPSQAVLSDINEELIISWEVLKVNSMNVIKLLKKYVEKLNEKKEEFYYYLRKKDITLLDDIEKTARFLFLNKTCFNGLYRVNSKNQFNTPFNGKSNIKLDNIINKNNLEKIIYFLNNNSIQILNKDYKEIINSAQKNDLIFCDPPYDSDTKTFNGYNSISFSKKNQEELYDTLKKANKKGVKWILTNHDTKLINHLYRDYYFTKIPVDRFINSQSNNRKNNTFETIITNFALSDFQKKQIDNLLFLKELKNTSYFVSEYVSWKRVFDFITQNKKIIQKWNNLFSSTEQEFFDKFNLCWEENQSTFKFLPILIANNCFLRKEKFIYLNNQNQEIVFDYQNKNIVSDFIKESNLLSKVFLNTQYTKNIESFLSGILIGLDSNSRKNKSGKFLPKLIADILETHKIEFKKEVELKNILKENELIENKKFDFVFEKNKITYCLECSFFNVSGSKINSELNRMLAFKKTINQFKNYKFLYIIDGPGLKTTDVLVNRILNETDNFLNIYRFQKFLKK